MEASLSSSFLLHNLLLVPIIELTMVETELLLMSITEDASSIEEKVSCD